MLMDETLLEAARLAVELYEAVRQCRNPSSFNALFPGNTTACSVVVNVPQMIQMLRSQQTEIEEDSTIGNSRQER